MKGRTSRIKMAANIATTPPSLFGMDRRMAYAQRKYHSGLIWVGVTRGFAGMKFSGSFSMLGARRTSIERNRSRIRNPTTSFDVKYQWKGTLSEFELIPRGLLDPVWWRNSKWMTVRAATTNGIKK